MITIRWYGHACFEIVTSKGLSIVIDPHDGRSIGLKPPRAQADVVLITHEHFDHNAYSAVAKPSAQVFSMKVGEFSVDEVHIAGVSAYHDRERGRRRGENVIYRIYVEGLVLAHLGDLGHELDQSYADKLKQIDILMIPVGGTFTIDAAGAWKTIEVLKPRSVIPMHYWIPGTNLPLKPVDEFLSRKPALWKVVKVDSNTLAVEPKSIEDNTVYVLKAP